MHISDAFLKQNPLDAPAAPAPERPDILETLEAPEHAGAAPHAGGRMAGSGMTIRRKVALAFGLTGLAIAGFILTAIDRQYATAEQAALLEARHVGYGIADTVQEIGIGESQRLQEFVALLNQGNKRDVVIVDAHRIGIADADPGERGHIFDHDGGGEVARTLSDGVPRTFIELNPLHPEGIRQIVVPVHEVRGRNDAVVGAVILEYTPIREELLSVARDHLKVIAGAGAALIVFIFLVGLGISRQVTAPLRDLKNAVLRIKSQDYAAQVGVTSADEIGVLGRSFNEMARALAAKSAALQTHKAMLEQRIADRTAELRVANHALLAEVEERKLSAQRNEYLAYYDSLTDLPNRAMFSRLLRYGIDQAQARGTQLALLFVDLDRFKNINDTLGHATGDQLLQEMARRLKSCLRADDAVARLGGDEFVVILQHITEPAEVEAVARKILAAASKPFGALGQEFHVTASVGISLYPQDGGDERSLMKNADIAMYHAKDEGKNNFQLYSAQLDVHTFERLTMESALRQAMAREEFELFYQPKIDVASGRMSGMEALLRWRHPEAGLIPPAKFIPLAEETGLILPIGKWVLRTACAQNVKWNVGAPQPLCIAVNLSARQFGEEGLLGDVVAALRETGMDPSLLELEITESMLMRDIDKAIGVLTALKQMGVRIAMDDFGTGYSSLSNLKKFPLDTIKVDRSFVRDLPGCFEDRGIAEAIFAMGRALSLTVVAEGVETEAQADFLRLHACDKFQGYLFSHPLSSGEFGELLGKQLQAEAA